MSDYIMHHGIKGQKWGIRNGPPYPLPAGKLARQVYDLANKNEPRIKQDINKAVLTGDGKLHGIENEFKTVASITRKIKKDAYEKDITEFKAAKNINDALRYTLMSDENTFVSNYNKFKGYLEKAGYKESKCKNYYSEFKKGNVEHKAVQSVFKSPDGYSFEVQFHTKASWDVKEKKLPLYEEAREMNVSNERMGAIKTQMHELALSIPDPKDIYTIKSH